MINTKNLTMDQEVAVMMPTGGICIGNYMAQSEDRYIVLVGDKTVECKPEHMYPIFGVDSLVPRDFVKPLEQRDGRCGYFHKVDGSSVILFSDTFESGRPEKARPYPMDTKFALIGESANRPDDVFGGNYNAT
jgi:hypothetical protein